MASDGPNSFSLDILLSLPVDPIARNMARRGPSTLICINTDAVRRKLYLRIPGEHGPCRWKLELGIWHAG
jgi:hypothetical protein